MDLNLTINEKNYTDVDTLISDYIPFIINTTSTITNRYICIENDEEFSIALAAFYEAISKYNENRGPFLAFAKLVINSRITTYLKSQSRGINLYSIDDLDNELIEKYTSEVTYFPSEEGDELTTEITALTSHLEQFGFTLTDVATDAPKHIDTRDRAIKIGEDVSTDKELTCFMYTKLRLPITLISTKFSITQKIIKTSKKFIITVVIIFDKNYRNLKLWIRK